MPVLSPFPRVPAVLRPPQAPAALRAAAPQPAGPASAAACGSPGHGEPGEGPIPPGEGPIPPGTGGNAAGGTPEETCGCLTTRGRGAARLAGA